ncbi:alpha/beta hydrolase [Desulfobacterales bacterium HSG2]|nr:alpha/beta hydrolase [Desulfobacterales bacterium HSG2]
MEDKITFLSENDELEGLFDKNTGNKGVVVTHPHPLYGGDMYNYVVEAIVRVYQKKGYSTLRFNFRGVGKSRGTHDNGIGEQTDVRAAISYLFKKGIKQADLAGYSFGAWVNAKTDCKETPPENMVMVSPPVGFMNFQPLFPIPCLKLIVSGSMDDIAPAGVIKEMIPIWNPEARFEVIAGADHFYTGYLEKLESILEF